MGYEDSGIGDNTDGLLVNEHNIAQKIYDIANYLYNLASTQSQAGNFNASNAILYHAYNQIRHLSWINYGVWFDRAIGHLNNNNNILGAITYLNHGSNQIPTNNTDTNYNKLVRQIFTLYVSNLNRIYFTVIQLKIRQVL